MDGVRSTCELFVLRTQELVGLVNGLKDLSTIWVLIRMVSEWVDMSLYINMITLTTESLSE